MSSWSWDDPGFVPLISPGSSRDKFGENLGQTRVFSLFYTVEARQTWVCPWDKPGLSLGQTWGRRAAQKVYVKKVFVPFLVPRSKERKIRAKYLTQKGVHTDLPTARGRQHQFFCSSAAISSCSSNCGLDSANTLLCDNLGALLTGVFHPHLLYLASLVAKREKTTNNWSRLLGRGRDEALFSKKRVFQ